MSADQYTIEVKALDWIVILSALINRHDLGGKHTSVVIDPTGTQATFFLNKSVIPATALAAAIGSTPEAVEAASNKIVLMPLKGSRGWPSPTVDYYGMA